MEKDLTMEVFAEVLRALVKLRACKHFAELDHAAGEVRKLAASETHRRLSACLAL